MGSDRESSHRHQRQQLSGEAQATSQGDRLSGVRYSAGNESGLFGNGVLGRTRIQHSKSGRPRWFSEEYWQDVQGVAEKLRSRLSMSIWAEELTSLIQRLVQESAARLSSNAAIVTQSPFIQSSVRANAPKESGQDSARISATPLHRIRRDKELRRLRRLLVHESESSVPSRVSSIYREMVMLMVEEGDYISAQRLDALRKQYTLPDADELDRVHWGEIDIDSSSSWRRTPRVAILSLLFSWPSTGGGTIHTLELATQLSKAGYQVQHISATYAPWGIGASATDLPYDFRKITFDQSTWTTDGIRRAFSQAMSEFSPDVAIITDSWNSKVTLAESALECRVPFFLRLAAMESICPLNNVRLLPPSDGVHWRQCEGNQLRDAATCRSCVQRNERYSGSLHVGERALSEFSAPAYAERLNHVFRHASGVLTVNPAIADLCNSSCRRAYVVPSGFEYSRFGEVLGEPESRADGVFRVLFAGVAEEPMKGFQVILEAMRTLALRNHRAKLLVTSEPLSINENFLEFTGWKSQVELVALMKQCDAIVFPTIAQEGLGRTAVEAMGCGRPVVASNIGGLSWVVEDGVTGFLVPPGDYQAIADAIQRLISSPQLVHRLGAAGRAKFTAEFTWEAVMQRHYHPLLAPFGRRTTPN